MVGMSAFDRLVAGEAFVDLSSWRTIAVTGADATPWLNDLVSADVGAPAPGEARTSLLLSPLGGVLAGFTVARFDGGVVLIQDPAQPRSIGDLLAPYVLSSDVRLEDRTGDLAIVGFPGRGEAPSTPDVAGVEPSRPSCLGRGVDLIAPAADRDRLRASLATSFVPAADDDAEAWRVDAAIPRVGVDTFDGDLPQECGLETAVAFDKGCFLGQEAVAKSRNLGHPRRLLLPLEAEGAVAPGDEVVAPTGPAGVVTSAARVDGRSILLARVGWAHRDGPLRTREGIALRTRLGS